VQHKLFSEHFLWVSRLQHCTDPRYEQVIFVKEWMNCVWWGWI